MRLAMSRGAALAGHRCNSPIGATTGPNLERIADSRTSRTGAKRSSCGRTACRSSPDEGDARSAERPTAAGSADALAGAGGGPLDVGGHETLIARELDTCKFSVGHKTIESGPITSALSGARRAWAPVPDVYGAFHELGSKQIRALVRRRRWSPGRCERPSGVPSPPPVGLRPAPALVHGLTEAQHRAALGIARAVDRRPMEWLGNCSDRLFGTLNDREDRYGHTCSPPRTAHRRHDLLLVRWSDAGLSGRTDRCTRSDR